MLSRATGRFLARVSHFPHVIPNHQRGQGTQYVVDNLARTLQHRAKQETNPDYVRNIATKGETYRQLIAASRLPEIVDVLQSTLVAPGGFRSRARAVLRARKIDSVLKGLAHVVGTAAAKTVRRMPRCWTAPRSTFIPAPGRWSI